MSAGAPGEPSVITARGVRVEGVGGPLPEGEPLELRLDPEAMTFHSGHPPAAWQIPYSALRGSSLRRRGDELELSGWIAGTYGSITIPLLTLEGGSEEQLAELLGRASGVIAEPRRRSRLALGLLAVAAILLLVAGLTALFGRSSSPSTSSAAGTSSRSATGARNLILRDLPSGWVIDDQATSPIGGLLSSGSSGSPSASAKASFDAVAAAYESCVGVSSAADRIFGAAGVTPAQQLAGKPLGIAGLDSFEEAGSVTQRYASSADVGRDLVQIRSPRFSACFAEAIGRLLLGGGTSAVAQSLPTTAENLPSSLGVYSIGSDVALSLPDGAGGTVPVDLGVSVLIHGNYEQTLYTLASPATFDPTLRATLVSTLAGRLLAAGASSSA